MVHCRFFVVVAVSTSTGLHLNHWWIGSSSFLEQYLLLRLHGLVRTSNCSTHLSNWFSSCLSKYNPDLLRYIFFCKITPLPQFFSLFFCFFFCRSQFNQLFHWFLFRTIFSPAIFNFSVKCPVEVWSLLMTAFHILVCFAYLFLEKIPLQSVETNKL